MPASAQELFAAMVARDVVPVLRSAGYHGTGGTWSLTSPIGDTAIVNLQKSKWNTAAEVAFTVNLSLVPRPWYEWLQREYGHRSSRKIREYDGLWRDRLHPSQRVPQGGTEFWLIKSEADATACGADVAAQLIRAGLPRLSALLDRDQLLRAIRAGNFGFLKMPPDKALAIMLSEEGPSVELDVVIGTLEGSQWDRWKGRDDFVTWIRERSARPARP